MSVLRFVEASITAPENAVGNLVPCIEVLLLKLTI
jgi:hypothetical protein